MLSGCRYTSYTEGSYFLISKFKIQVYRIWNLKFRIFKKKLGAILTYAPSFKSVIFFQIL
jgi:hypothetical protein